MDKHRKKSLHKKRVQNWAFFTPKRVKLRSHVAHVRAAKNRVCECACVRGKKSSQLTVSYKYWWYNFYLFISVGCSMEYDCMWQDQANSRNDRTSQTLPELYATKITRFVIIFKVKNLSQDLYMTR